MNAATVTGQLRRVWQMIGAERLSQLRVTDTYQAGTAPIGAEFAAALRLANTDLGATMVRAHAILHDDNAVTAVAEATARLGERGDA